TTGITSTTITLARTAGANPCTYGASLTFQATVSPTPPNGETVTFYSGATSLGTATTSGGVASLTTDKLASSSSAESLTATYSGDASYAASTSAVLSQTVTQAILTYVANPESWLVGTANPSFSGTVTGFVNGDTQAGATTGTLVFATTATASSPAGSYQIDGSGLSAKNYTFVQAAGNATALTIAANFAATTTTLALTAGASPCSYGASLTFQATVSPPPPNGETVAFYSGPASFGTTTMSGGVATLTTDNLAYSPSAQSITAAYLGDSGYAASTSSALSQAVNQAVLTYVANPVRRFIDVANPTFSGTVTGFVNGETQSSATTGTLVFSTTATVSSPIGSYPIDGSGLSANNYSFAQAAGNATALTITVVSGPGSDTWNGAGADNNWQTLLNWAPGSANMPPIPGDALFFSGMTRLSPNNNYPAGTSFNGLTFNPGAGAFVLGGFSITNTGQLADNATSAETINFPIYLSTNENISVISGGTMTINGPIVGAGLGLIKSGGGLVTLTGESAGANTYSGGNTINSGTFTLDYSEGGSTPAANLIVGGALSMGGGALYMKGSSTLTNSQAFASTTFTGGSSTVVVAPASGTVTISNNLALGALTYSPGATVMFVGPGYSTNVSTSTGQGGAIGNATTAGLVPATANITTTSGAPATAAGNGVTGQLTGSSTGVSPGTGTTYAAAFATVGLYDYAIVVGSAAPYTIIGASQGAIASGSGTGTNGTDGAYTLVNAGNTGGGSGSSGGPWDLVGNCAGHNTDNLSGIRFNAAGAATYNAGGGTTQLGGILVTPNVGAFNIGVTSFQGGLRSSSYPGSVVIWQNNTNGFLNITGAEGDGKVAGVAIVQAGPGTVSYTAANTYTGPTYLNGGVAEIVADSGLGAPATGAPVTLNGGAILADATFSLDNGAGINARPVVLTNNGGALAAVTGFTLTVDGVVSGSGPLMIGIPPSSANGNSTIGRIPGTGAGTANSTELDATGTVILTGANTCTGSTTINAGTLALSGGGSLSNSSISIAGGAKFDVSAISTAAAPYNMGGSSFTASGNTAATLNIASGGFVTNPLPTTLTLTSVAGAVPNPALTVAQGTLVLSNNQFTINGPLLPAGIYTVVNTSASGAISFNSTWGNIFPTPTGTALGWPGTSASIAVSGSGATAVVALTITSATSCAGGLAATNGPWTRAYSAVDETDEQLAFGNTNGIYSVAGYNMINCTFSSGSAIVYGGVSVPVAGSTAYPVEVNAGIATAGTATVLPAGTTNLTLIATETTPGSGVNSARVNALVVADGCSENTMSFDPISATLYLSQSGEVQIVFNNISQNDKYVSLQNGTPGLSYARVIVNGTVFALDGLADGINQVVGIGSALTGGAGNTVVVEGFGTEGAGALVSIGETPAAPASGSIQVSAVSAVSTFINLPILEITQQPGNQVLLSWPATGPAGEDFTAYQLQTSASGLPGSWSAAGTAPVSAGGQLTVTVTAGGSAQFYELAQ
ncbi:MAG: Ig-like domain repeat protein, partial [Verrucomicrobiota bacterium]